MVLFDFKNFYEQNTARYKEEVYEGKTVHDNVKIFNEQMPDEARFQKALNAMLVNFMGQDFVTHEELFANLPSGDASGDHTFAGNSNEEKAWNFFIGKGFTKEATAGVMGNMKQESNINPKTIQNGGRGPGTGLIQWGNNADGGRWNQLEKWASKQSKDKWAIETQLEWLWIEMNDNYHTGLLRRRLQGRGVAPGNKPLETFGKLTNMNTAMYVFDEAITRAGKPMYANRLKYTQEIFNKFKNYTPPTTGGAGGNQSIAGIVKPSGGQITSGFGRRIHPTRGGMRQHNGIDTNRRDGLKIVSVLDGTVTIRQYHSSLGNYIKIDHGTINGKKFETMYAQFGLI